MKKLTLIIILTSAMLASAEDNESRSQEKVTDIFQILEYIQNLPTEEVQKAKTVSVNVMSHYCSIRARQMSNDLALRARKGQTIHSFESKEELEEYGEQIVEIGQRLDKEADAFVRRCGWMLE